MSYITIATAATRSPEYQKGAFLAMTAGILTILIGFSALAIDVGYSFAYRERMRHAADSAALAGAMAKHANETISDADLTEIARDAAENNGFSDDDQNISVNVYSPPRNPPNGNFQIDYIDDPTAVGVEIIRNNKDTFFALSSVFASQPIIYRSVANRGTTGVGAMFLFKPSGTAINISGSNSRLLVNGFIYLNSTSNSAISTGSGQLIAGGVGTVAPNPTCLACYKPDGEDLVPTGDIVPMQDPLRHVNPPVIPSVCNFTNKLIQSANETLNPGTYCSINNSPAIEIKGRTATFNPGVYILKGGGLSVGSGGGIRSTVGNTKGVMIYNTGGYFNTEPNGNPVLDKKGQPSTLEYPYKSIDFRGATSGVELFGYDNPSQPDYKGMLIFQDRNNGQSLLFGSSANTQLNGIVYIINNGSSPSIIYNSNSDTGASGYTIFVISSIELSGGGRFTMNSNYGSDGSPLLPRMSLAE